MAENRYNVDDILREVKEKRAREERAAQPEKRATTTTEDLLRQLDAAQTGLSRAAGAASERPAPAKTAPQPVKKAEPFPGELLQKTEAPAAPAPAAEPEFKWEEPKRPEPVMQPEEWTPPKKQEVQPAPELGEEMPMGREIPVARAKKPLWEASAARKSAEALMQTLKNGSEAWQSP